MHGKRATEVAYVPVERFRFCRYVDERTLRFRARKRSGGGAVRAPLTTCSACPSSTLRSPVRWRRKRDAKELPRLQRGKSRASGESSSLDGFADVARRMLAPQGRGSDSSFRFGSVRRSSPALDRVLQPAKAVLRQRIRSSSKNELSTFMMSGARHESTASRFLQSPREVDPSSSSAARSEGSFCMHWKPSSENPARVNCLYASSRAAGPNPPLRSAADLNVTWRSVGPGRMHAEAMKDMTVAHCVRVLDDRLHVRIALHVAENQVVDTC